MSLPIVFDSEDGVAVITLNAPERRNALTPEMLCRLADGIIAFSQDPALRVAVITGAGDRAFCAGGDLGLTIPLMTSERACADDWDRRLLTDPQVMEASGLRDFPLDKPVIAAVNGACFAAGFELLLGTDIRLCTPNATFALPEVQRAVIPFAGSLARLPRQVPYSVAMELMLSGQPIDATEAHRVGLVNRIVPADRLMSEAMALARRIAANGPLAVQAVKRTVREATGRPLGAGYALEDEAKRHVLATEDAREGPRAFLEKRAPRYSGR